MNLKIMALIAAIGPLAACAPAPAPAPAPEPLPVSGAQPIGSSTTPPLPALPPQNEGIAGLEERQPDSCHAKDYVPYLGQPGTVIPTLSFDRPYRVVEYRGIEDQKYDPTRIVFRLDAAGNIYNIDCG